MGSAEMNEPSRTTSADGTVIRNTADQEANDANMAAIDESVATSKYVYIIAWGKWLGFTPATVQKYVSMADAENAPVDVVQKIDGKWIHLDHIENDANRKRVVELAGMKNLRPTCQNR